MRRLKTQRVLRPSSYRSHRNCKTWRLKSGKLNYTARRRARPRGRPGRGSCCGPRCRNHPPGRGRLLGDAGSESEFRTYCQSNPRAEQFVLVNEAVNLGIAIYNMQQGEGVRHETLFRDETVGALDPTNAKEYVRMLRRAMDLGAFYQVIFICHTPLVWELADQVVEVSGGRVVRAMINATGQ